MGRAYKPSVRLTPAQKKKALALLHKKWEAHENQKKILRAIYAQKFKRVFVRAGRKFGKNELANYLSWRTSISKDMGETYIIGSTAEDESKIIWENERLQDFGPNFRQSVSNTSYQLKFPWGSFIQIDGCRNAKAGRGRTFDLCVFDEGKDQKRDYYDAAYPNLLAKDGTLFFIGTPPDIDDPDGAFYRALEEEAIHDKDWAYFRFSSWDNPLLPREWLINEKAKYIRRGDELIWKREYEAEDVSGTVGRIFPMFQYAFHVRPVEVLLAEIRRGLTADACEFYAIADPGQDVFAILLCVYNNETGQLYILDEIYQTDRYQTSAKPMWTALEKLKAKYSEYIPVETWEDWYDEAASQYEVEIMKHFNVKLTPTQKRKGKSIEDHVSLIKDALSVPKGFQIASHCTNTAEEIMRFKDLNAQKKNHCIDIIRYFVEACGYDYRDTIERLIVDKTKKIEPRGYSLEDDVRQWAHEEDPFGRLTVMGDFEVDDYGDIFGF